MNTEKNWDKMARAYEDFTGDDDAYTEKIEWLALQALLPDLQGKSVLDIGCGTGKYAFLLEQKGAGDVLGVDLSENMLALAREKAAKKGAHAQFMKFDAQQLSTLSHAPFDLLFSSTLTHYLPDLEAFFQGAYALQRQTERLFCPSFIPCIPRNIPSVMTTIPSLPMMNGRCGIWICAVVPTSSRGSNITMKLTIS